MLRLLLRCGVDLRTAAIIAGGRPLHTHTHTLHQRTPPIACPTHHNALILLSWLDARHLNSHSARRTTLLTLLLLLGGLAGLGCRSLDDQLAGPLERLRPPTACPDTMYGLGRVRARLGGAENTSSSNISSTPLLLPTLWRGERSSPSRR